MTFADKIKQERARLNLSQEKLARMLSVSTQTVYLWEQGKSVPIELKQRGALAILKDQSNGEPK